MEGEEDADAIDAVQVAGDGRTMKNNCRRRKMLLKLCKWSG